LRGKSLIVAMRHPHETRLWWKYRRRSMIPRRRFTENLAIARQAVGVGGDVVECGTWKGGMSAALAELLPGRRSVLFDSYEGLPPPVELDGERALGWGESDAWYLDNCAAAVEDAEESMRMSGSGEVDIRKGWFEQTVPAYAQAEPAIALLRLDGDWYESTLVCLRHLFPLVAPGGVVLIDDYDTWEGCTRAVHEYLGETQAPEPLERGTDANVTFLVRRGQRVAGGRPGSSPAGRSY
jgi:O-methyltransferase